MHTNVHPEEIDKFAAQAQHWWDESGQFAPLHRINPLRLGWINRHAGIHAAHVLDVGCGGGILAEAMARAGAAHVTGIDLASPSLQVARLHAADAGVGNVSYREVAVEALAAERPASFDIVTCMEMLEHVPSPESVVRACAQLVRPGGWVFFSTINRNAKSWALAIAAAEYVLNMVPRGTHDWNKFIRPAEMAAFCRDAGLYLTASQGIIYRPLMRDFVLSADCDVNYMLAARKPV